MRYRIIFPILFGSLAVALVLWDMQNLRVIQSIEMSWDTGAPIWPYEAPKIILSSLNAPAFLLAAPFFYLPHLQFQEMRYPVLLPAIVVWWWWLGTRFDFGILGLRRWSHSRWWAAGAITLAFLFSVAGTLSIKDGIERWTRFPDTHLLILAKIATIAVWCFALAVGCSLASRRLWRREFSSADGQSRRRPVLAYGIGVMALAALATSLAGTIQEPKLDRDSCIVDDSSGCVHGTVIDAAGKPIRGLNVEVLPADNRDETRWPSFRTEFSDSEGRFSVDRLEPGVYVIAVHHRGAPFEGQPYRPTFYPGREKEDDAEKVIVAANSRTFLSSLTLRSVSLARIKIIVRWKDGTKPTRANVMFHNVSFPNQAVIGDVAPQIDDGAGEFLAPFGFDYTVQANVQCDAGNVIESRESTPQSLSKNDMNYLPSLTLTLPGAPCQLWRP